jgi:hypothetical protein
VAATPTEQPTVEPTVVIIDVSQDPNARLQVTARARTPTSVPPTAMPTPEPTAVPSADQDLVGGVVAASMEPLLFGGRIGLLLGGIGAAGYLIMQHLRRR